METQRIKSRPRIADGFCSNLSELVDLSVLVNELEALAMAKDFGPRYGELWAKYDELAHPEFIGRLLNDALNMRLPELKAAKADCDVFVFDLPLLWEVGIERPEDWDLDECMKLNFSKK